ncbi:MAG: hypothetical protein MK180_00945 [Rhodobacteraceae bacterium]|nr:hypothetical protein [Paracoccaceae bacterium]
MKHLVTFITLFLGTAAFALSSAPEPRTLAYDVRAPKSWPVWHSTTFNRVKPTPGKVAMVDWTGDRPGTGSTISARIPALRGDADTIEITNTWAEYQGDHLYTAALSLTLPEGDDRTILEFQGDGRLVVFVRGAALRQGGLGRPAVRSDYDMIAAVCATRLSALDPNTEELVSARDALFGIVPADDPSRQRRPARPQRVFSALERGTN